MGSASPLGIVFAFIVGFYVVQVSFTVAVFATAMQLCWKRVAATQFTLYMAFSNLGLAVGPALFGQLSERFTPSNAVFAYLFFAGFSLALLHFVRLDRHQPAPRQHRGDPEAGAAQNPRQLTERTEVHGGRASGGVVARASRRTRAFSSLTRYHDGS